jgi:hypothetical protein
MIIKKITKIKNIGLFGSIKYLIPTNDEKIDTPKIINKFCISSVAFSSTNLNFDFENRITKKIDIPINTDCSKNVNKISFSIPT